MPGGFIGESALTMLIIKNPCIYFYVGVFLCADLEDLCFSKDAVQIIL